MYTKTLSSLQDRDRAVIWHPYTQHKNMQPLMAVAGAKGTCIYDESGRVYIDAISSWWTNLHGHSHPYIAEKLYSQALQLEHVIFAGCTHEPAVALAEQLLPLLPGDFSKVFYSDNGSTAVEVALKMALQFQKNKGARKRNKIIALKNAYHGDTFGAMSVSERGIFTLAFEDYLFDVLFIEPGSDWTLLKIEWDAIACFIYEPLVQGAGGMILYDAEWLNEFICHLKQQEIICIADEVMTGFGRTGNFFASEYIHHKPDIICLSKGLTGGSLPLAITACRIELFEAFLDDDAKKTFFHGHSYTANPLACAAALASLELLQKEECMQAIDTIGQSNKSFIEELSGYQPVKNPRSRGTILAFEINSGKNEYLNRMKETIINLSLENGVFLRPLGNTVYIMPPYCITREELQQVYVVIKKIASMFE